MISSISNTLSALKAYATKSEVQANNIANATTDGFERQNATLKEAKDGGVQVDISRTAQHQSVKANEKLPSNTDIVQENIQSDITLRGYQANLKQLETEESLIGTTIDVVQ